MIIFVVILCIIAAAFFAGIETGLISADQLLLYSKKEKGILYAKSAYFLLKNPQRLLATTLIGTNIFIVTATVLLNNFLRGLGFSSWISLIFSLFLSIVLLIFAEIIPKSFFSNHADTITVGLSPILLLFYIIFLPVSLVLNVIVKIVFIFTGQYKFKSKIPSSKMDLRYLLQLKCKENSIPLNEQRIIDDIFDFGDTLAREVMVPLHKLSVYSSNNRLEQIIKKEDTNNIRFIPICEGRTDNLVGYIDKEDIIFKEQGTVKGLLKDIVYYPETKKIPQLLMDMNEKKIDIVFLCDEYGGISGMITPSEIIADIVGHIPGNELNYHKYINKISNYHFVVHGKTDIEDLAHETGIILDKGVCDTIGGFICNHLGKIPEKDEGFMYKNVFFKVLERDSRSIKKIEILKKKKRE